MATQQVTVSRMSAEYLAAAGRVLGAAFASGPLERAAVRRKEMGP